jgi:K+-sensing histidine kinase KdpD
MNRLMNRWTIAYVGSVAGVAAVLGILVLAGDLINRGSASCVLLLAIAMAGRFGGVKPALAAAVIAAAGYDYFYLPPYGFAIGDVNNWISFVTFVVTGLLTGRLVGRTARAMRERDQFERLYWTECGRSSGNGDDAGAKTARADRERGA